MGSTLDKRARTIEDILKSLKQHYIHSIVAVSANAFGQSVCDCLFESKSKRKKKTLSIEYKFFFSFSLSR